MNLAFSTIALPDQSVDVIAELGARCGFQGVEVRFIDGRLVDPRMSPAERRRVKAALNRRGLRVIAVDTSLRIMESRSLLADLKAFIQLAAEWEAPVLRVFGGELPAGSGSERALEAAAERLDDAAREAATTGVRLGVETHDMFARARDLAPLLARVGKPGIGAVWDLLHPHRSGESPDEVWQSIGKYILHVHVRDARQTTTPAGWQSVPLGEGEVPVAAALLLLKRAGYNGWLSVEWERAWHRELAPAEDVLPRSATWLRGILDTSENIL